MLLLRVNGSMNWKVAGTYAPPVKNILPEVEKYGMKAFTISNCMRNEVLAKLFLELHSLTGRKRLQK